ncbi:YNFM family putative membrane transporter [Aquimarina sp. MAR_2010_214]|nr:YNFM family putative membrane transporter [Aquimarina sp. MAR_2010_214]
MYFKSFITYKKEEINKEMKTKAERNTRHYKEIRKAVFIPGLAAFSQFYMFQPLLPSLSESFLVSPAISSLVVSSSMVGIALGLFMFAFYADILHRKKLMLIALFLSSLITILSAVSWNFNVLVVFGFIKGFLLSGVIAVAIVYISEEVEVRNVGIVIGIYLAGNVLGGMWGRVVAGLISSWYDWRIATLFIGGIGVILSIFFMRLLPQSLNFNPQKVQTFQKLMYMKSFLKNPLFSGVFILMILMMGTFVSIYNYLSFRLEMPPFSLPHYIISLLFLIYITGAGGTIIIGVLTHRIHPFGMLKILLVLFLIGTLGLLVEELWLLVLGLSLVTFSLLGIQTVINKIISQYAIEGKSTANCLYLICQYMGAGGIGSSTGHIVSEWGWSNFIFTLMGFILFSLLLFIICARRYINTYKLIKEVS